MRGSIPSPGNRLQDHASVPGFAPPASPPYSNPCLKAPQLLREGMEEKEVLGLHKALGEWCVKRGEGAGLQQSQERLQSGLGWGFSATKLQLRSN